jgi:hypothetical protein
VISITFRQVYLIITAISQSKSSSIVLIREDETVSDLTLFKNMEVS